MRIIVAVFTDSNDVVSWLMFCGLVGWGLRSDAKCNYLLKILAVEYILLLQFCDKFDLGVKEYICSLHCKTQ